MIHFHIAQGALRHGGRHCVLRVLHNGDSSETFYGVQTSRPVIEIAGEKHSDDAWPIAFGGRAKQRINGRPMEILPWSARQPNARAVHLQVMIGRRHINVPFANSFSIDAVADG